MTTNLVCITDPASPAAEAYRRLRVNLTSPTQGVPLGALLVVAAGPEPDKASVVANLAVTFARVGKRVILVDADLRQPAQHAIFNVPNDRGLTTALDARSAELPLQDTGVARAARYRAAGRRWNCRRNYWPPRPWARWSAACATPPISSCSTPRP